LSAAMKRRPPNPERVAKMAATKRGKNLTDEQRARISAGLRDAWAAGKWATRERKGNSDG
jgi:hypothetical protein